MFVGEITQHFRLQRRLETFHDGSLQILVFARIKLYSVTFQQGLKRRIQKFTTLVTLNHVALLLRQNLFESVCDVSTRLCSNGDGPSSFGKHIYAGEQVSHSIVEWSESREIHQIDLIQVCDAFGIRPATREANSSGFV
jgi:hypothetical protein